MYWSKLFIPTLREVPAEAEVASHRLMLRAGYVRQLAAGVYSYLLLAQRSLLKIQKIIREEMEAIGAQEMHLPALNPADIWQESGRWDVMGDNMFRLKDRFGRELCLGMTHEEVMTGIARGELNTYRQLPQIWYQIQTKFRDEPRPRSGLLRTRQFTMKDSYSFDLDAAGLDAAYDKHFKAYNRIFSRCGLEFMAVEAHSGAMGGSQSHEFMVLSEAGEDFVAVAKETGYAANLEKAISLAQAPAQPDVEGDFAPEEFHTPRKKTIAEVAAFTGLPESSQMKSLVMVADEKPLLVLLRGDHSLSETKLEGLTGAREIRPAHPHEILEWFGAEAGSLGPIGVTAMRIVADKALRGRRNMICGANKDDFHLKHVTVGKDFEAEFADLRQAVAGDRTADGKGVLEVRKAMEIGHIFKLGYKYSDVMGLRVLNDEGKEVTPIMGSYGIGVERILAAAIELFHDKNGIVLPAAIAPFDVVVTPVNPDVPEQFEAAERIYRECREWGIDVLFDDRKERAGVKFKDADLIGVPFRVTVGKKIAEGVVEIFDRRSGESVDISAHAAMEEVLRRVKLATAAPVQAQD